MDFNNLTKINRSKIIDGIRIGVEKHHQLIEGAAVKAIDGLLKYKSNLIGKTVVQEVIGKGDGHILQCQTYFNSNKQLCSFPIYLDINKKINNKIKDKKKFF